MLVVVALVGVVVVVVAVVVVAVVVDYRQLQFLSDIESHNY